MTNRAIAHARLRNSRLIGTPLASAAEVVGWFGAVQSQDVPGALWGIAQRMRAGSAHIVLRDGFVVGGWRRALAAKQVTVTVTLLIPLTSDELDALAVAAAAFGRFIGLPVELRVGAA